MRRIAIAGVLAASVALAGAGAGQASPPEVPTVRAATARSPLCVVLPPLRVEWCFGL